MSWQEIESVTLTEAAASVSFTSGLTAYKFFRLTAYIVNDANAGQVFIRLNSDTGNNYIQQVITAQSTSVTGARTSVNSRWTLNKTDNIAASQFASLVVLISKPAAGVKAQMVHQAGYEAGAGESLELHGGEWNNTAALISSIEISKTNMAAGTSILLEGLA